MAIRFKKYDIVILDDDSVGIIMGTSEERKSLYDSYEVNKITIDGRMINLTVIPYHHIKKSLMNYGELSERKSSANHNGTVSFNCMGVVNHDQAQTVKNFFSKQWNVPVIITFYPVQSGMSEGYPKTDYDHNPWCNPFHKDSPWMRDSREASWIEHEIKMIEENRREEEYKKEVAKMSMYYKGLDSHEEAYIANKMQKKAATPEQAVPPKSKFKVTIDKEVKNLKF